MTIFRQVLAITATALFVACAMPLPAQESRQTTDNNNVLILYLSRTQNTKVVASLIREKVGGTAKAMELKTPYPEDYDAIVKQVREENQSGYLPPLKPVVDDLSAYDVVFLGFPTWGMKLPPPVKSFLSHSDLSGKAVYPFNTNAGYGVGSSFDTVKRLCRECNVKEGFSVTGGIERDGVYLAIKGTRKKEVRVAVNAWLEDVYL